MGLYNKSYILQRWHLIDEGYGWFGDRFVNNEVKHSYPAHNCRIELQQQLIHWKD